MRFRQSLNPTGMYVHCRWHPYDQSLLRAVLLMDTSWQSCNSSCKQCRQMQLMQGEAGWSFHVAVFTAVHEVLQHMLLVCCCSASCGEVVQCESVSRDLHTECIMGLQVCALEGLHAAQDCLLKEGPH